MGNVRDLVVVRHPPGGVNFPVLGLAVVMCDKEACVFVLRVVGSLRVVLQGDGHVVGLAFDHNQGVFLSIPGFGRTPEQEVGAAPPAAAPRYGHLLFNLLGLVPVLLDQNAQVLLANSLLGGELNPLLTEWTEYLVAPDLDLVRFGIGLRCWFPLGHTASFYSVSSSLSR